ncbi:sulfotransferase domain-containing protein [uncultured Draconibacterium sp.]|uniref:sulfotransferase domain-containing protein n=1 Tax=uncultured Draconibacterium sp. TaxID=1573823 RepID=UPI003260CF3C
MNNLPNFLVVGASKSGTSSLYHYLNQHPNIFLSKIQKEGRYFSQMKGGYRGPGDERIDDSIHRTLEDYSKLFAAVKAEKAIGDISPEMLYFYEKGIPKIKAELGEKVKIIIILRSPIERAFSAYLHFKRDKREERTFEEGLQLEEERLKNDWIWAWQYKNSGLYYKQVKSYIDNFKEVKVILFDDFKNNPDTVLSEIAEFLEVESEFKFDTSYKYNVSGAPKNQLIYELENSRKLIVFLKRFVPQSLVKFVRNRFTGEKQMVKPEMDKNTKAALIDFFRADILKLQQLIGKDLSHWLDG